MRRRISSKSNSCTEGMIVYVAGIGMKAGVPYPGRSVCLPRATLVKRCGDEHTEVSRGHSRSEMFDDTLQFKNALNATNKRPFHPTIQPLKIARPGGRMPIFGKISNPKNHKRFI